MCVWLSAFTFLEVHRMPIFDVAMGAASGIGIQHWANALTRQSYFVSMHRSLIQQVLDNIISIFRNNC